MKVVLDANLIASLVLPLPYSDAAAERILAWKRQGVAFAAPALWRYEVNSVLRKAVVAGYLPADQLEFALVQIWGLNIQDFPATLELQRAELSWAERIQHSKIYDSAYLAIAEMLKAELWTADRRLVNSARTAGAGWVYSILDD
jgi:predicted nucleic acid-binding protein